MSARLIDTDPTEFVQSGPIRLAYQAYGKPDDPSLVLIMGLSAQMIAWPDDFCRRLAGRGLRVIRFDNRDVGLSTHVDGSEVSPVAAFLGRSPTYRLIDMARDTVGLIEQIAPGGAHVVGISMGGMIAQMVAVLRPDLVTSLTSMCSTTGSPRVGRARPGLALRTLLTRPVPSRAERIVQSVDILRRISSPGYPFDEAGAAALAGASYDRGYDPAGGRRQFTAVITAPDRTAALGRLRMPTLVLHGTEDPLIHLSGGVATAQAIPTARLMTFAGMGHDVPEPLWDTFVTEIGNTVSAGEEQRA